MVTRLDEARYDYGRGSLGGGDLATDPLHQLQVWTDEALRAGVDEATAVVLATVDANGVPDARVVLLRGIDDRGVWWFTNRRSPKGEQLAASPYAAVVAHWQPLERQVRLRGPVELLPDAESDAYFASRPRDAQIGAWASDQSDPVDDRRTLDVQVAEVEERFAGREVPRPDHWGGYLLRPQEVEFWQGRPARLHDRLRYRRRDDGWGVVRLQP
jgi:pyridoxamine 5'-phosphate oxidase